MRVIRASDMGMCFGVRDALAEAFARTDAHRIAIHGELVHNETVNERLRARGYVTTPEDQRDELPDRSTVLVTAHGVSERERERLRDAGKELVDTTCPLVRRAHDAAVGLARDGFHVLVIGKPGHVEVEGLVGDLDAFDVVSDVDSVRRYPADRLGVVCQTTCQVSLADRVTDAIRAANPHAEVRVIDTICEPTRRRISAIDEFIDEVDAVVVVGGRNSNNTKQLARRVEGHGVRAFHVQGADDLDPAWFDGCEIIGLTAGTSSLDETIDAVQTALERMELRTGATRAG